MAGRPECSKEGDNPNVVVIRQHPYRRSIHQTQIDNERFIERRRNAGPLFDKMKQLLTLVTRGKLQKGQILALAERIAQEKHLKIDRGAKRIRDCLICWFCEHSSDILPILLPHNEMTNSPSISRIATMESDRGPLDRNFMSDEGEITWMMDSDLFQ
jgi:hypothetical protein